MLCIFTTCTCLPTTIGMHVHVVQHTCFEIRRDTPKMMTNTASRSELNCWSHFSFVLFILNLLSCGYVHLYGVTSAVPPYLRICWILLSVLGIVISVFFQCYDCYYWMDDIPKNREWIHTSQWVFLASVCDLLGLLLILFIMKSMSSDGGAGVADILFSFQISSTASLLVSAFRFAKVFTLGCPNCNEKEISELSLCVLYGIVFILSCVVIVVSWYS